MQAIINRQLKSPLGDLKLSFKDSLLVGIAFTDPLFIEENQKTPYIQKAIDQLIRYFSGNLKTLTIPYQLSGTPFQNEVWNKLLDIPYGKTISYGKLSTELGDVKKVRAVTNAIARNPLPIIIPCHRVIGKNGNLAGYLGGLLKKEYLLRLEDESQLRLF
ncbi:MAG: methylated-DNA-[protein]-cysteine S-methyltransferase [Marivirga sp.]|jgi:methylated-DNA-[protein]-cysteine S-methyltransferase